MPSTGLSKSDERASGLPAILPHVSRAVPLFARSREERKRLTHLIGRRAPGLNDTLTQSGFRRSQTIAYRPACEACRACVSVRVKVADFALTRGLRRIAKRNVCIDCQSLRPQATSEQYSLFRQYVGARHHDGGMADMTMIDYQMMVEDSHVETRLFEYRLRDATESESEGRLVACCLTDVLADGLSMVYSFYDPNLIDRSLGAFMNFSIMSSGCVV